MGSSGMCSNSDAVSSRSGFGDVVCLSVLLQLCCQCVHCISLEWNFTFCNAGEKLAGISVVNLCGAASW